MNLSVNARDAMPKGGRLVISTGVERFEKPIQENDGPFLPGDYVKISAEDNGTGIDPETSKRYSIRSLRQRSATKERGSGLRRSWEFVKQYRGFMRVKSEVNRGTFFECFIPVCESLNCMETKKTETIISGGDETILIVEDDETFAICYSSFCRSLSITS
jgi:signal transduction histidine kinase